MSSPVWWEVETNNTSRIWSPWVIKPCIKSCLLEEFEHLESWPSINSCLDGKQRQKTLPGFDHLISWSYVLTLYQVLSSMTLSHNLVTLRQITPCSPSVMTLYLRQRQIKLLGFHHFESWPSIKSCLVRGVRDKSLFPYVMTLCHELVSSPVWWEAER